MATIKPASMQQKNDVYIALQHLKRARVLLTRADCPNSVERVRGALKSTEGAYRHIGHRVRRSEVPQTKGQS